MKTSVFLFILFFVNLQLYAQELEKKILKSRKESLIENPLTPSRAAFYSAIIPGLGQAYIGQAWKIPLVYGAIGSSVYYYSHNKKEMNRYRTAYKRRSSGFTDDEFMKIIPDKTKLLQGMEFHKKYRDKNLYESISSYGVGFHRHNSEIQQEIDNHSKKKFTFTFTPHLTPMFRGILSTIYLDLNKGVNIKTLEKVLNKQYSKSRFVKILKQDTLISTNDVINTNNCYLSICKTKYKNRVIILSVIDNLIKGGAGQAIQNMNLKFNFPETKGL